MTALGSAFRSNAIAQWRSDSAHGFKTSGFDPALSVLIHHVPGRQIIGQAQNDDLATNGRHL
jgi:hypothetical protein